MRFTVLAMMACLAFTGEASQAEQDRLWAEAMAKSAAIKPAESKPSPVPSEPVDYDALAAQRHKDAEQKLAEAKAETRARQDSATKEQESANASGRRPRWTVPVNGKAVSVTPLWAQGAWKMGEVSEIWILGAKTLGIPPSGLNSPGPIAIRSVLVGDEWCAIETELAMDGWFTLIIRKSADQFLFGKLEPKNEMEPEGVAEWRAARR